MADGGYTTYWRKRWKKGYHKDHLLWVMMDYFIDHAAFEDCEIYMPNYGVIKLKRGQAVFGTITLAKFLGASRSAIRNRINLLKQANIIATKSTNKYSIATVLNYNKYQFQPTEKDHQNDQQTDQREAIKGAIKPATNNKYNTLSKIIINHLNKISGRRFTVQANVDYIIPRLKEGYTKEQCIQVIEKKWADPDFNRKYFCPETLFRKTKFEKYLNQDINTEGAPCTNGKILTTEEIALKKWQSRQKK